MRVERRRGTVVGNAIKREAAGRAFEASCPPVDGQVFNNVTRVRTSQRPESRERAMDHVAVVESQQENSGATPATPVTVYRRVDNVDESPDVRRITRAGRAGLQGSILDDADAMTV